MLEFCMAIVFYPHTYLPKFILMFQYVQTLFVHLLCTVLMFQVLQQMITEAFRMHSSIADISLIHFQEKFVVILCREKYCAVCFVLEIHMYVQH